MIQFNIDHCEQELKFFGQEIFESSDSLSGDLNDPAYVEARALCLELTRTQGIDRVMAEHNLDAAFHDFKKQGVDAAWLKEVTQQTGWQALLNTRGTTWRKLSEAEKATANDEAGAMAMMLAQPSIIKRPVLEVDGRYHLGFTEAQYQALFKR